ncbi:Nudix hydrolase [Deinococcus radiophilus]|uniref:NUDIX domain-containing protein n=1 Tax=Deinococcus radiophilus TaxID=32062 RepID=A0A3S0JTF8_9DEIO|nr:Nudix hydrolase [Deinococcus radiophilus]RTR28606.1 NUDIX domain-containing protein [Deinococcus radiophilus]UFA51028.1 NUDIX domain-containing protein [Deinococcus radiophilus]
MQYDQSFHVEAHQGAGVVILDDAGRILLIQERGTPDKPDEAGLWHLPVGSVEPGENPQDAAVREAWEETGLRVRVVKFLNTRAARHRDGDLILRSVWLAEPLPGQELRPALVDEVADARYFTRAEVEELFRSGRLRIYTTPLFYDEALAVRGSLETTATESGQSPTRTSGPTAG